MNRVIVIYAKGNALVAMPFPDPMPMLPLDVLRAYSKSHDFPEKWLRYEILEVIPLPEEKTVAA